MNFPELVNQLVLRGCPPHPRLIYEADRYESNRGTWNWYQTADAWPVTYHRDDARAVWTAWALEWVGSVTHTDYHDYRLGPSMTLEAIEEATRNLEPS